MKQYVRHSDIYSRNIDGTWVILSPTKKVCFELNEVAGVLWEAVNTPKTILELSKHLFSLYEIDNASAERDVEDFIFSYQQKGLLEEVHA